MYRLTNYLLCSVKAFFLWDAKLPVCVCNKSNVSTLAKTVTNKNLLSLTEKQAQAESLSIKKNFSKNSSYKNNNNIKNLRTLSSRWKCRKGKKDEKDLKIETYCQKHHLIEVKFSFRQLLYS